MRRRILPLMVFLTLSLGPLEAQEAARERARMALPAGLFGEIDALASQADRDGIPSEPLFNKALEGLAKRVPPEQLLPAVNRYAFRLREAHGAFGAMGNAPLIVAGADALQRGVDVDVLRRLGRGEGGGGGPGPSPMAVLVLAELVEAGVQPERALGVLQEAIRMRAREQHMLGIPAQVRQLMRQGQSPQEAAEQVRRALQQGRGGGGVGPPVPPGSEPTTRGRRQSGKGGKGGG